MYYVPLADQLELRRTRPAWARRSAMRGIHMSADEQVVYLKQHVAAYEPEYHGNRTS
jgi:predicted metal-binding transcription factor (methanogenesis marker protein 9)